MRYQRFDGSSVSGDWETEVDFWYASLQEVKGHRTDPRLSYEEDRARRGAGEGDE